MIFGATTFNDVLINIAIVTPPTIAALAAYNQGKKNTRKLGGQEKTHADRKRDRHARQSTKPHELRDAKIKDLELIQQMPISTVLAVMYGDIQTINEDVEDLRGELEEHRETGNGKRNKIKRKGSPG